MNSIFSINTSLSVYIALSGHLDDGTPFIEITHNVRHDELSKFSQSMYQHTKLNHPPVAATIAIRKEDFDVDYFTWGGFIFTSERMREAMALDASQVQFFELDDSQSAPLPRSKKYQMMELDVFEDVADRERSPYAMTQFLPNMPPVPSLCGLIATRAEAAPEHELFYDDFFDTELLCTEPFALRVLRAGCTGMMFRYLNRDDAVYRTLRGIETIVMNIEGDIYELVEAID